MSTQFENFFLVLPAPPSVLNVTAMSSRSMYVSWRLPHFTGYTNITAFLVEIVEVHNILSPSAVEILENKETHNISGLVVQIGNKNKVQNVSSTDKKPVHYKLSVNVSMETDGSVSANQSLLVSEGLRQYTSYRVRLRSINEIGTSDAGDTMTVKTFPEGSFSVLLFSYNFYGGVLILY